MRQGRRDLTLVRMTPDVVYDQIIGMGCARRLVFSWAGNPGVGSLHRVRDAVEHDWPAPLEIEEHSHAAMAAAYAAGASALPFAVLRGYAGTDLPRHQSQHPLGGVPVHERAARRRASAPARRDDPPRAAGGPERQRATLGNRRRAEGGRARRTPRHRHRGRGGGGLRRTRHESSARTRGGGRAAIVDGARAICRVPGGAHPSYAAGYSHRDNAFYSAWDAIARDRDRFRVWMREHVLERRTAAVDHA